MAEVEVKLLLSRTELAKLRKRLARAKKLGKATVERNFILDYPGMPVADSGCLVRLRFRGERAILTFKGPRKASSYKSREETEFFLGKAKDYRKVVSDFSKSGLSPVWRYDKIRQSYSFAGAHIDVDTLPVLGTVVEVEADSDAKVQRAVAALGLLGAKKFNGSYYDLAAIHFRKKGLPVRDLVLKK
jgi:adenylate cyclase class 2